MIPVHYLSTEPHFKRVILLNTWSCEYLAEMSKYFCENSDSMTAPCSIITQRWLMDKLDGSGLSFTKWSKVLDLADSSLVLLREGSVSKLFYLNSVFLYMKALISLYICFPNKLNMGLTFSKTSSLHFSILFVGFTLY